MFPILFIATVFISTFHLADADPLEKKLIEMLLDPDRYDPLVRPVVNFSEPVNVKLGVILQQIVSVDEKNQFIEVNVWLKFAWTDVSLKWNPEEYGNVQDLRFPVGTIWKPDVLMFNSADPEFETLYLSNLVVYYDGTVNWIPPGIVKSSCNLNVKWFPFDDQTCHLKFGSWTYHGWALDLQPEDVKNGMDTSEYLINGEWTLISTPVDRVEKFYGGNPEPYVSLSFNINIRRRTLYYQMNVIIPSLLITFLMILGFTLPPDACEKVTLEITILLSIIFFMDIVADMTPRTSEAIPIIVVFFSSCMWLVTVSIVGTAGVINLSFRDSSTHTMTPTMRKVLLKWLPWLLRMKRPGEVVTVSTNLLGSFKKNSKQEYQSESLMRNVRAAEELGGEAMGAAHDSESRPSYFFGNAVTANLMHYRKASIDLETKISDCIQHFMHNPKKADIGIHALILQMRRIHTEIKFITNRMEREDEAWDAQMDWRFAAMVIDRLCLLVFGLAIISSTGAIFLSTPNIVQKI